MRERCMAVPPLSVATWPTQTGEAATETLGRTVTTTGLMSVSLSAGGAAWIGPARLNARTGTHNNGWMAQRIPCHLLRYGRSKNGSLRLSKRIGKTCVELRFLPSPPEYRGRGAG